MRDLRNLVYRKSIGHLGLGWALSSAMHLHQPWNAWRGGGGSSVSGGSGGRDGGGKRAILGDSGFRRAALAVVARKA